MADSKGSRILNFSNHLETDSEQQYVEVDSNTFLGTKDGIKYTIVQTSDNVLRLVEILSDSAASVNTSKGCYVLPPAEQEDVIELHDDWVTPTNKPKMIKLMALNSKFSPCMGQGDEIGNSVISPTHCISSFKASEGSALEKVTYEETPSYQDCSSQLTYTTLLPKQEKSEVLMNTYNPTPTSSHCSYPNSVLTRPPRNTKKPRLQLIPSSSSGSSPITKVRFAEPKQKRGRGRPSVKHYTPQVLLSTPNTLSRATFSSVCRTLLGDGSSGSSTSPSFDISPPSIEYPRVPNNTPVSSEVGISAQQNAISFEWIPQVAREIENYASLDAREIHNQKERNRRMRIKIACQCMRSLLPYSITEKIDNASIFEQTVDFISFMRETVGDEHDMEFLEQNLDF